MWDVRSGLDKSYDQVDFLVTTKMKIFENVYYPSIFEKFLIIKSYMILDCNKSYTGTYLREVREVSDV